MNNKLTANELEQAFIGTVTPLKAALAEFPWSDRDAYAQWLAQTYHFVKHTIRYLCLSAGRCGLEETELHQHALKHIREETGHEQLALQDLKQLGYDIKQMPAYPEIEVLTQSQYYWLDKCPPAFMGYSLCLEGLAAGSGKELLNEVFLKHYPPKACSFVRVHSVVDDDHFADGLAALRKLELSTEEQQAMLANLRQTAALYGVMLLKITDYDAKLMQSLHGKRQSRSAA